MDEQFCQSCGMPLSDTNKGTNADRSQNNDYCMYCYKDGRFAQDFTMSQMIEFCLQFTDQINKEAGLNLTPVQAKEQMLQCFPHLKRWREKDGRTLAEKAVNLLSQCENVTVVSIDTDGYPRPVQMSKIHTRGFNEVWMATSSTSVKVSDFRKNSKAGLCTTITVMECPCVVQLKLFPIMPHAKRCGRNGSSTISQVVLLTRIM